MEWEKIQGIILLHEIADSRDNSDLKDANRILLRHGRYKSFLVTGTVKTVSNSLCGLRSPAVSESDLF